ncbi:MAG TPA: SulP family inorganic anion transporter [Burkholderiaceae bacterium]|nr:SulP family inorganic anion transporter [Burkholderiaceae bacterium]
MKHSFNAQGRLQRMLPMTVWWNRVNRETLRADVLAGLSGTIILVPQAVAYATIAGLPPEFGLYTAIVPVILAALFGSSWHLVSGPTAALSIVLFATLSPLADPGSAHYVTLAMTLTFLVGILQLAMGLARLGSLVNFISHSVVIGFTAGAGILIAVSQFKNFLGLSIPSKAGFIETLQGVFQNLGDLNPYSVAVGTVTLVAGILTRRYVPQIPFMIAAMLVGSLFAAALTALFGAAASVATVTAIPRSLPPLSHPDFSMDTIRQLSTIALAVAMLSLTEALSIARAVALKSGQRIDGNQEFVGQGLANFFGSFFSGYVSSGSFTRSGINYTAGARTPLAAVFSSLFLVLTLLVFAPLVSYLPIASMAALLFMVAYSLIDTHHIKSIGKTSRTESAVLWVTLFATLFLDLEFAIYVGVLLSLIFYIRRTATPNIRSGMPAPGDDTYHFVPADGKPECPQLKIAFVDGSLYFGAVDHVQQTLQSIDAEQPTQKHVLILASGINFVDVAGAHMFAEEAKRRRAMGGGLYFHRLKTPVVQDLAKGGQLEEIGEENLFEMRQNVMDRLYAKLDPSICRNCPHRVFRQCHGTLPNGEAREESPGEAPTRISA